MRGPIATQLLACLVAASACSHEPVAPRAPASAAADAPAVVTWMPARLRRLTNLEYARTVAALTGIDDPVGDRLPPDVRQDGYTPNAEQAVPSAWATRLAEVARDVAHRVVSGDGTEGVRPLDRLVPCAHAPAPAAGCGAELVDRLGPRAYRRSLEAGERAGLLAVFAEAEAQKGGGFDAGAEALLTAILESPSLVYVTELGPGGPPGAVVTLTPYEIASLLAYTLRGGPPDDALLRAAASGTLLDAGDREAQARRLLALSDTRFQFRRFVLEWLEVDGLSRTAKNEELYPAYDELKAHMVAETAAFADEVMVYGGGSVRGLLDARFASVDPALARYYGLKTWGARASLATTRRAGVLQQASFLAAHAHEDTTSPVQRGDFVLRRVLCTRLPRPAEVGIDTVFPPPSPTETTRERFAVHADNPACRSCHRKLDAFGFPFEAFDAAGAARASDNQRPIDTTARVVIAGRERAVADSRDLSEWLAAQPEVADCYLRQAFRYFTAQADPAIEGELLALARQGVGAGAERDNLFEALVAYVRSDLFIRREVRP